MVKLSLGGDPCRRSVCVGGGWGVYVRLSIYCAAAAPAAMVFVFGFGVCFVWCLLLLLLLCWCGWSMLQSIIGTPSSWDKIWREKIQKVCVSIGSKRFSYL
jgi:hypothetical protein